MRLDEKFYSMGALEMAPKLIGKILVREIDGLKIYSKIVETEAYVGPEDKACHAYNNKRTKRTETMFLKGGLAYVYLIYGMYNCLNVVATDEEKPEAVLIRAVEPLDNIEFLKGKRKIKSKKLEDLTNGPGKLCMALSIDRSLNGYNMIDGNELYIINGEEEEKIETSPRINIDYAKEYVDKHWRFYIRRNRFVSK